IWLYDIKLLVQRLSTAEWRVFWGTAKQKQLVTLCRATFSLTAALLGLGAQPFQSAIESSVALEGGNEPSAAYLAGLASRWLSLLLDLRDTPKVGGKLRFVTGHVFPDPEYMRSVYGVTDRLGLANAYIRRVKLGVWGAITSQRQINKVGL